MVQVGVIIYFVELLQQSRAIMRLGIGSLDELKAREQLELAKPADGFSVREVLPASIQPLSSSSSSSLPDDSNTMSNVNTNEEDEEDDAQREDGEAADVGWKACMPTPTRRAASRLVFCSSLAPFSFF
jgi:hypothetical protein